MNEYTIRRISGRQDKMYQTYQTMVIIDRGTGNTREYRLTPGFERAEIASMRRALNRHLDKPGATLGNYQW